MPVTTRSMARAEAQSFQGSTPNAPPATPASTSKKPLPKSISPKTSDEDAGQRPIRRRFKKASLEENQAAENKAETSSDSDPKSQTYSGSKGKCGGRVGKKRSFDEVAPEDNAEVAKPSRRGRKRSRSSENLDTTAPMDSAGNGESAPESSQNDAKTTSNDSKDSANPDTSAEASAKPKDSSPAPSVDENTATKIRRKRSLDDLDPDDEAAGENAPKHVRKRSKSSEEDEHVQAVRESNVEETKNKKESMKDAKDDQGSMSQRDSAVKGASKALKGEQNTNGKPEVGDGFANIASESPFASLSGSKSPKKEQETSSDAFAASGFASFVSQSPFAAVNASASPFAAAGPRGKKLGSGLSFGSANSSALGAQSGFGQLGNSLGSKSVFGGRGSTISEPPAEGKEAETKEAVSKENDIKGAETKETEAKSAEINGTEAEASKQAGTVVEKEEMTDEDEPELFEEARPQDSRFYEQEVETGEEEEETKFEARAKLFVNTGKEWKERGVGLFKVNVSYPLSGVDSEDAKPSARFIMRADGTHRVSINSPITKEVQIQDKDGKEPKQNTVFFMGAIDGKMRLCLLRMRTVDLALDLYEAVQALKQDL